MVKLNFWKSSHSFDMVNWIAQSWIDEFSLSGSKVAEYAGIHLHNRVMRNSSYGIVPEKYLFNIFLNFWN